MNMLLLLALALAPAQDSVDTLLRKLSADSIEERTQAETELLRRGQEAMKALDAAHRKASDPAVKADLRRALEKIMASSALAAETIKTSKVTLRTEVKRLSQITEQLHRQTRVPFEIDGNPPPDPLVPELEFKDAPLEEVLDTMTRRLGGFWLLDGNRVLLLVPGKVALRLFDVRDLSWPLDDEPALPLSPRPMLDDTVMVEREAISVFTGEDLANLIRVTVHKDSWEEADGKSLVFLNGLLILRNDAPVLADVEKELAALRAKFLVPVRVEIEAYACKAGEEPKDGDVEAFRRRAAEGRAARIVASFQRTTPAKRQIACGALARSAFLTGYDPEGTPAVEEFRTGPRITLRVVPSSDGQRLRVEFQAGFSKVLSVSRKKTDSGEIQVPEVANHVLRGTEDVAPGRWTVLGRVGECRLEEGLPELVLLGRFVLGD